MVRGNATASKQQMARPIFVCELHTSEVEQDVAQMFGLPPPASAVAAAASSGYGGKKAAKNAQAQPDRKVCFVVVVVVGSTSTLSGGAEGLPLTTSHHPL